MPEDLVFETLVKRDNGRLGKIFPIVSITSLVIFLIFLNGIPILLGMNIIYFTGMISFGLCYLIYRVIKNQNVEYEISIINDTFSVTKIRAGKKRIDLASFSIRSCEYIGPVDNGRYNDDLIKADFSFNCTSLRDIDEKDPVNWYAFVSESNLKYMVFFEIEDDMYPLFRRYNAHRTAVYTPRKKDEPSDDVMTEDNDAT